jgi:cell wall-associated NlpC family hydrolase
MSNQQWASEETCQRLATIARGWLGTPFHHRAAVRGVGVDCVTLMGEVFREAGVVEAYSFPPYSLDYSLHQSRSILREWLDADLHFELLSADTVRRQGDIACFKIGKTEHHAGLLLDECVFIHALRPQGVLEARLDDSTYAHRLSCLYRPLEAIPPTL